MGRAVRTDPRYALDKNREEPGNGDHASRSVGILSVAQGDGHEFEFPNTSDEQMDRTSILCLVWLRLLARLRVLSRYVCIALD